MKMSGIEKAVISDGAINVEFVNGMKLNFEDCWLRDLCRCTKCYNHTTFQRTYHLLELPDVLIEDIEYDSNKIKVIWSDLHESTYTADFLSEFQHDSWLDKRRLTPSLWRGTGAIDQVDIVDVDNFLKTDEGCRTVFKCLLKFGVAFINNVEVSIEATEKVCQRLGGVQHTMYGGMWKITTQENHADIGFTNLAFPVHSDNTYFTEAAGLQALHCLEHNGVGGETILVDGFYGAKKLRKEFPEDFDFLTNFDLEAVYVEDGHHYKNSAPVIQLDKMNEIKQIRYNMYDRSEMAFSSKDECRAYYRSLKNLSRYYEDPENQWRFKLQPGLVAVMDNFRVLHGRTSFTGSRVLGGSYISRSDWLDRARVLKLIN